MPSSSAKKRYLVPFLVLAVLVAPAAAGRLDRLERRAQELALPDEVLDPQWPIELPAPGASELLPGSGDSVTDDDYVDEAEREEYERYLIDRGLSEDPATVPTKDPLGRDPDPARTAESGLGADYVDPPEW